MSQKWRRNKAWEDKHLTGKLALIRIPLRTLETIPLAIVLLTFICLYATAASIPIGMLAKIPTYTIYSLTLIIPLLIASYFAIKIIRAKTTNASRATRFLLTFFITLLIATAITLLWLFQLFPAIKYNHATGAGFRIFGTFSDTYPSTTLRRLPAFEMTEMQFYGWWPMKAALYLFVINLMVTTVRRIEFTFKNLGVLSVHTGIITIALGSLFYQRFKLEGDVLLPAAQMTQQGMQPLQPQNSFFSREEVVLFLAQEMSFTGQPRYEQRPIDKLPRYNNYNLNINVPTSAKSLAEIIGQAHDHETVQSRDLNFNVPTRIGSIIDPKITIDVVGYAHYAQLEEDWFESAPEPHLPIQPLTVIDMYAKVPGSTVPDDRPIFSFPFFPNSPAGRIKGNQVIAIEYTIDMPQERWDALATPIPVSDPPSQILHAIIVEIPELNYKQTHAIQQGQTLTLGDTGYSITVEELAPTPPFPIITPGYQDATSSVAILNVTKPGNSQPVSRWALHRFPELDQDLTPTPSGRPQRSDPDPAIKIAYLDTSRLQVYIDDQSDGTTRALVRQPATGELQIFDVIKDQALQDIVPNTDGAKVDLRFTTSWSHAKQVAHPIPTPTREQDKSLVGSHAFALTAVRVGYQGTDWSQIIWVPFAKYIGLDAQPVSLTLPNGSPLYIGFGRTQRPLPGFSIALINFEMIAYDHRGAPRDYQSLVKVKPSPSKLYPETLNFEPYEHIVKLNAPLRAPFHWSENKTWLANSIRRFQAGLNPNQFKFSQAGWDRAGWNQSQELVDQGQLEQPKVNFTILGVGNNPGIHIIAFGSILFSLGVPWAFYIKPLLVRKERDKIKAQLAKQASTSKAQAS